MLRNALVVLALTLMPTFATAQEHHKAEAQSQNHHKAHESFVQRLIDQRTSLKLTSTQVTKLKAFKTKMVAHHKEMSGHGEHAMHEGKEGNMDDAMHKELLSIFTAAQRPKIEAMLKKHMKSCGAEAEAACKVESGLRP